MRARLRRLLEEANESKASYLLLLPYVIFFLAFLAYPLLFAFYLTFHEWAIISPEKPFVGLQNVLVWRQVGAGCGGPGDGGFPATRCSSTKKSRIGIAL